MAVGRKMNWKGQLRVDVPHLRLVESGIVFDFDTLAGSMLTGRKPYVMAGFTAAGTIGADPTTIILTTAGSVIFNYGASENGTMLFVPLDRTPETLNVANSRVVGGFIANSTHYIGIDFTRTEDSATSDIAQFLDATSLTSTPKTIPLGRTLDYKIVISTSPFSSASNLCPVCIVATDASNKIASPGVRDARTLFFRLGQGGDSPTPLGVYTWPQGQGVGVTPTNEANSFTGGDKAIANQKDWMNAIMTTIWQNNAGEYWYSPTTMNNTIFLGGGLSNFVWAAPNLSWVAALTLVFSGSTAITNTVNPGNVNLNAGECMYVDFNRYTDGTVLVPQVASIQTLGGSPTTPGIRYILAWRIGANVFIRGYPVPVGGSLVGVATTTTFGSVKINSADANPYAVIADALGGKAIAAGLTRQGLGAGILAFGGGADDDKMTFITSLAAGDTGTDFLFQSSATRTAGNFCKVSNNGTDLSLVKPTGTVWQKKETANNEAAAIFKAIDWNFNPSYNITQAVATEFLDLFTMGTVVADNYSAISVGGEAVYAKAVTALNYTYKTTNIGYTFQKGANQNVGGVNGGVDAYSAGHLYALFDSANKHTSADGINWATAVHTGINPFTPFPLVGIADVNRSPVIITLDPAAATCYVSINGGGAFATVNLPTSAAIPKFGCYLPSGAGTGTYVIVAAGGHWYSTVAQPTIAGNWTWQAGAGDAAFTAPISVFADPLTNDGKVRCLDNIAGNTFSLVEFTPGAGAGTRVRTLVSLGGDQVGCVVAGWRGDATNGFTGTSVWFFFSVGSSSLWINPQSPYYYASAPTVVDLTNERFFPYNTGTHYAFAWHKYASRILFCGSYTPVGGADFGFVGRSGQL